MPRDRDPTPGHFWMDSAPDHTVPGIFEVRNGSPQVHLIGELTPALQLISDSDNVKSYGPADEDDAGLTIHGRLKGTPGLVTLVGAQTTGRSVNGVGVVDHRLRGRYAVLGGHVAADERFTKLSARLRHLDGWAHLGGPTATFGAHSATVTYEPPAPVELMVSPPRSGLLQIAQRWSLDQPTVQGAGVTLRTWATWEPAEAETVPTLVRDFVDPLATLLTLLYVEECPPTELSLYGSDDTPMTLLLPALAEDETTGRHRQPLLGLTEFGTEALASWFAAYETLTPLPQLVAGTITDARRTVHNQLLELATAAEGLDRRLHPGDRRLDEEEVAAASAALAASSSMDDPVKQILRQALEVYLWEPSYPQRLKRLAEQTEVAAPGATGRVNRWRAAVVNARVGFAHSLPRAGEDDDDVIASYVLAVSLRWVLTARMLLHAGVPQTVLAQRTSEFREYGNFLATAREYFPKIYAS